MRLTLLSFSEPSVYSQRNKCLMTDFEHQPVDYSWDIFMGAKETSPSPQIIKAGSCLLAYPVFAAAAAAKSLQSCPTLWDPIDGSPPGSAIPGILQARTLEWVAISFSNAWKWKVKVKSLSRVRLCATPWTAAYQAPPSMDFPGRSAGVGCHCLLRDCLSEFTQIHAHWVGDAIYAPHPLLPPSTFAFDLSQHQGLFQLVGSLHQVAKVLELQHQSFKWIFRVDFLWDWLVWYPCSPQDCQESSSAPQFESINSLALSFFMVQLSHPYMTTGKTIALILSVKVISLLFNMLSRFVIAFLPRSKAKKLLGCVWLFVTPWTIQSMEFSRPEYWSG